MSQPPVPGHHREELRSPTSAPKTTEPVVHSFTSSATLPPDPHPRLRRLLHIPDGMMNTGIHEYRRAASPAAARPLKAAGQPLGARPWLACLGTPPGRARTPSARRVQQISAVGPPWRSV